MKKRYIFLIFVILSLFISSASANDIYVSINGTDINSTGTSDDPYLSISHAVNMSNDNDTIYIYNGTYSGENNSQIDINKNLTIYGNSINETIIDGQSNQIFNISKSHSLTLNGLSIVNCQGSYGGAIYNYGDLNIVSCSFNNNSASSFGGVIYNNEGNVNLLNSSFNSNTARSQGGVIHALGGNINFINSIFYNNSAERGGVIYNLANLYINNSMFYNNSASMGGVVKNWAPATIENSTFAYNDGGMEGGAIYSIEAKLNVKNCNFFNNNAYYGGAIDNIGTTAYSAYADVLCSTFEDNTGTYGSAINNDLGVVNVNYSILLGENTSNIINTDENHKVNGLYNWWGNNLANSPVSGNVDRSIWVITTVPTSITTLINEVTSISLNLKWFNGVDSGNLLESLPNNQVQLTSNGNISSYGIIVNNHATVEFISNQTGEYELCSTVDYETLKTNITVLDNNKIITVLESANLSMNFKDGSKFNSSLKTLNGTPLSGKTIAITINGKTYYRVTDDSGVASLNINLKEGYYSVSCAFSEENYNLSTSNGIVIVKDNNKSFAMFCSPDLEMTYKDGTKFIATLKDSENKTLKNKNVSLIVNGITYNRITNSDGEASLNINLKCGIYSITSYFKGDNEFTSSSATSKISIKNIDDNRKVTGINYYSNTVTKGEQFKLKLFNENGEVLSNSTIKITINGKTYSKTTNGEGVAKLNINLNSGHYKILSAFEGNSDYEPTSMTTTLTVKS